MTAIATIDYHVTAECNQECPYCWGPQTGPEELDSAKAAEVVRRIGRTKATRIVFTGGDPLLRPDIGMLVRLAKQCGLEVALSTTGDTLTPGFLRGYGRWIDLISLPIDGATEEISSRTKKPGHLTQVLAAFEMLTVHPNIDVKAATPVTKANIADVPNIIHLLEGIATRMENRLFYNVFQAYPRAIGPVDWEEWTVSDAEFGALRAQVEAEPHAFPINWLTHETLDRLYVMVFPDGTLTIPSGEHYNSYGPFLEVSDLDDFLARTDFDSPKHLRHSLGWQKQPS